MKTFSLPFYFIVSSFLLVGIPIEGTKKKKNRFKNNITKDIKEVCDDEDVEKKILVKKPRGCSICYAFKKIYEGSAFIPTMLYYQLMLIFSERYALPPDHQDCDSDVETSHARARKIVMDSWERLTNC